MTLANSEEYLIKKNKYFEIIHNKKTNKYTVYTAHVIIRNVDYAYLDNDKAPMHVLVSKGGKWTLYDSDGNAEQYAQNVDYLSDYDDYCFHLGNSKKEYYTRLGKMRNKIQRPRKIRNTIKFTALSLAGLAILGGLAKCIGNAIAFDKTPATYLHIKEGVALFDTDGDKKTAEMAAYLDTKDPDIVKTYRSRIIQQGETHLISEWRDLGFYSFERIKQDKQNSR